MTAQEQQQRNSESSIAGSAAEPEVDASDADAALSEAEVAQVKSQIAEALGVAVAHDYSGASLYYDASTMASLNPFSLVGLCFGYIAFVFGPVRSCPVCVHHVNAC